MHPILFNWKIDLVFPHIINNYEKIYCFLCSRANNEVHRVVNMSLNFGVEPNHTETIKIFSNQNPWYSHHLSVTSISQK